MKIMLFDTTLRLGYTSIGGVGFYLFSLSNIMG